MTKILTEEQRLHRNAKAKEYRLKNYEHYKELRRSYWHKNKEEINLKRREHRKSDPIHRQKQIESNRKSYQKNKAKRVEYYRAHRDVKNAYQRENNKKLRLEILNYYSNGNIKCNCCGESELHFLSLDHINNDGYTHRKTVGFARQLYMWIKRNNFPPIFQVLCMNCNFAKGKIGYCPHVIKKETITAI